jgi:pyrrolysyl-tRNA synthetase-like protein
MAITLTNAQVQRIRELDGSTDLEKCHFDSETDRESCFDEVVADLVQKNRTQLRGQSTKQERSEMGALQEMLSRNLATMGFMQVHTPTIISATALLKMGLGEGHPLREQVFWLQGEKRCLRPMLAPNLYVVMRNLAKSIPGRFGIFEIGSCFRKESRGSNHLEEFTMLNLVEIRPVERPEVRMNDIVRRLSIMLDLPLEIVAEESEVYGSTWDVMAEGTELASAAFGPHPLDRAFHVDFPWMGIGLGLERTLMVRNGSRNIRRHGGSLAYLNGARMDL